MNSNNLDSLKLLVRGFSALRSPAAAKQLATPLRFRALLTNFSDATKRSLVKREYDLPEKIETFRRLATGYREAEEIYAAQQETHAPDFNLLEVLQLTFNELRHSMVLAWLLDYDLRRFGTHGQGTLGFRIFLSELRLPSSFADHRYWVAREVSSEQSRVDIEIACRNQFVIHIENKIRSSEGQDQTSREWQDLEQRAPSLGLDPKDRSSVFALFLTPSGKKPTNDNFVPVSWRQIVRVLEQFAERAKPLDVKLFAAHYARTLRRFVAAEDTKEAPDGNAAT